MSFESDFDFFDSQEGSSSSSSSSSAATASSSSRRPVARVRHFNDHASLRQAWVNEQQAPEILPFETQLVFSVKTELSSTEKRLQKEDDQDKDGETGRFQRNLIRMQLDRTKYVLTAYLRVRLRKIEDQVLYVVSDDAVTSRLSPEEERFATRFAEVYRNHIANSFLSQLPPPLRRIPPQMSSAPNTQKHIIFKAREDIGDFLIDTDEAVPIDKGHVLIMRYEPIKSLLREKQIDLI